MSPRYVVVLAVLLRVGWVLAVPTRPVGDFAMYLESAAHLLEHGALDPEFVFMPGYVGFVAGLMALGAGLLAIKLTVAVAAGLCAGIIIGVTSSLWDERAGVAAGMAYAIWPAGIAVTSVTGTDLPTALLIIVAVWILGRTAVLRPWTAAALFGLVMGIAATVRAVAVPLAGFSFFYFLATGKAGIVGRARAWSLAIARAGLATVVALAVLAPWAWRNHQRYGDWFITDSHGGLTALVGANPNSDGRYSRSLNRIFKEASGYTLLAEPHRLADRASYQMARDWMKFSPAYAAGLVVTKAQRLLSEEKSLLYWPVYRAGVLRPGIVRGFFERGRPIIEAVVDGFWWALAAAFFAGVGVAVARRRWDALWFVPIGLALLAIYAFFFAEVRYQLPIVILMFPIAGGALVFARDALGHLGRWRRVPAGLRRELGCATAAVGIMALLLPGLTWAGDRLRERNRFGVHVFALGDKTAVCKWRPTSGGLSPVRGIWDGVGLRLSAVGPDGHVSARAELDLPPARYWIQAQWDLVPVAALAAKPDDDAVDLAPAPAPALGDAVAIVRANDTLLARAPLSALLGAGRDGTALPIEGVVDHPGGPLALNLDVQVPAGARGPGGLPDAAAVWLTKLSVVRPDRLSP
jgi:4-amino-4-deoxy-L-arabinose transferase-like glycosyltransferase